MTNKVSEELKGKKIDFDQIPVLDLQSLIDGKDTTELVKNLRHIMENVGFLYVKNHGIDEKIINNMLSVTKQFFKLPADVKEKINIKYSGLTLRGYIGIHEENVDPENTKDFKECFDCGAETPDGTPFFGKNPFPELEMPEFGKMVIQYHDAMLDLAKKLSGVIALSLGLEKDYFADRLNQPITIQRILRYPSQEGKIDKSEIGIGAHTDYGFLTVLYQDDIGGLQVQNHNGDWISAPPIDGTFVINTGDLLQTLTGGLYVSTMHRVINASGKERYSMPFFMDMNFDANIEVVETCKEQAKENVEPYKCGHHKFRRFADSYAHLEGTDIDKVLNNL